MTGVENNDLCCHSVEPGQQSLAIPDCLGCMRQKLRATCVVVFFKTPSGDFQLSSFQGDKPEEDAEAEFIAMLKSGLPAYVASRPKGVLLSSAESIAKELPTLKNFFSGCTVIGASVHRGDIFGVRIAWRDVADPFESQDLETLECCGNCPPGCV